jgi:hypothetical protein
LFFFLFPHTLNPLSHKWARGNPEPAGIAPFSHSWEKGKGMRVILKRFYDPDQVTIFENIVHI